MKLALIFLFIVLSKFCFASGQIKIINGQRMSSSIYPQVQRSDNDCTVSFIGPRTIITAAHCVTSNHFELNGQLVEMHIHPYASDDTYVGSYDVAIGILKNNQSDINPLSLCSINEPQELIGQFVTQIGFGCNSRAGSGSGVKRFNYTQVSSVQKDFIRFDAGSEGAVGCFGDSGGPYLLRNNENKSSCVLAIHFDSDLKRFNMATNVFYIKVHKWLENMAYKKDLSICGLNTDCPLVP